jgi:hypothetical protein
MDHSSGRGSIYGLHNGDGVVRYIGQTIQAVSQRLGEHRYAATHDKKYPVYDWMRKYGPNAIALVVLAECPIDELNAREIALIGSHTNLLNVGAGGYDRGHNIGNKSRTGMKASPETRERMRQAQLRRTDERGGWHLSAETRAKMSATHTGMKHTPETLAKLALPRKKRKPQ